MTCRTLVKEISELSMGKLDDLRKALLHKDSSTVDKKDSTISSLSMSVLNDSMYVFYLIPSIHQMSPGNLRRKRYSCFVMEYMPLQED